ncbi:MAG: hypothetical protein GF364_00485, partial [Candidatus Lokiarchaeota archaeon]|nr:hypothetical protein [Candidatus Lokiarchaeota archaeon]
MGIIRDYEVPKLFRPIAAKFGDVASSLVADGISLLISIITSKTDECIPLNYPLNEILEWYRAEFGNEEVEISVIRERIKRHMEEMKARDRRAVHQYHYRAPACGKDELFVNNSATQDIHLIDSINYYQLKLKDGSAEHGAYTNLTFTAGPSGQPML